MSRRLLLPALGLLMALRLASAASAAGPGEEKLAGEDDKAVPTAVPTPLGDEAGPVQTSRSAQAASSFDLPAFVVTGGGERKALAHRQDLSSMLDTSGGIKTSPGEAGAGKDQLEAQGGREALTGLTVSSRPFVGGVRLSAGWAPGYAASGYLGQELGQVYWLLDGDAGYSEGGPRRGGMQDRPLSDAERLGLRAGWRFGQGADLSVYGRGVNATRVPEPLLAGQGSALRRGDLAAGLDLDGRWLGSGVKLRVEGAARRAEAAGLTLTEDDSFIHADVDHLFNGRTGSALLELGLSARGLSQVWGTARRSRSFLRGSLLSRFKAWDGAHLGLGLGVDGVLGDDSALQLGPLLRLDQRLGNDLSLRLGVESGLEASALASQDPAATWRLPNPGLKTGRRVADADAALYWRAGAGLTLGLGGGYQQGEDWHLPQSSPASVVAVDASVRGWRLLRGRLNERLEWGPWWQEAEGAVQKAELPDLAASLPTFVPGWTAALRLGWTQGPWKAKLGAELLGPRHAAADGSLPLDPSLDLTASLAYRLDGAWSLFAEGRNLAAQAVEPAPFYPDAAPYVGLGVELRF